MTTDYEKGYAQAIADAMGMDEAVAKLGITKLTLIRRIRARQPSDYRVVSSVHILWPGAIEAIRDRALTYSPRAIVDDYKAGMKLDAIVEKHNLKHCRYIYRALDAMGEPRRHPNGPR